MRLFQALISLAFALSSMLYKVASEKSWFSKLDKKLAEVKKRHLQEYNRITYIYKWICDILQMSKLILRVFMI